MCVPPPNVNSFEHDPLPHLFTLLFAGLIYGLNPDAHVLESTFSKIDLTEVLNTGRFSMEQAREAPGWLKVMRGQVVPESEEYGVSTIIYRQRRPFHPARFEKWLSEHFLVQERNEPLDHHPTEGQEGQEEEEEEEEEEQQEEAGSEEDPEADAAEQQGEEVEEEDERAAEKEALPEIRRKVLEKQEADFGTLYRSKGFFWLSTRNDICGAYSHAGAICQISAEVPWFISLPKEFCPIEEEVLAEIQRDMQEGVGDRRQELVFIGKDLKKDSIFASLDSCLVTEEELGQELEDPFDPWFTLAEYVEAQKAQ